jgi:hypothetical protein
MKTFDLTDSKGNSVMTIMADTIHNATYRALNNLEHTVTPYIDNDDDTVMDYHLVDTNSKEEVSVFKTFFYENALTEALSILGYSVYEL